MTRQLIPTGQHNRVFLAILTDSYSRSHSEKSGQEQQFEIPLLKSHSPKCSCLIIRVQMNSNPLTELHLILYESLFSRVWTANGYQLLLSHICSIPSVLETEASRL